MKAVLMDPKWKFLFEKSEELGGIVLFLVESHETQTVRRAGGPGRARDTQVMMLLHNIVPFNATSWWSGYEIDEDS